ncbi:AtpZ/AtpI family protein [Sphingomicrobium nitratireducens]|uniref:AtpZ/AtpI family protein n=1 Tax=Sphingomicrobium nitratireducens TaxID=2964666 RepID=UPI00223F455B|nr:AtpZ/AtpI family protein [Sphingomicrobium nitratireducens]
MVENEPGQAPPKTPEDARIDSLEERLRDAQVREATRTGSMTPKADESERLGNKVLSLLIGGLAGGALVGWVLDRLFDTGNLLLVVFLVLGTVGGFWSIIKLANRPRDGAGE